MSRRKTTEYYAWKKQVRGGKEYCECYESKFLDGMERHAHHLHSWVDNIDKNTM